MYKKNKKRKEKKEKIIIEKRGVCLCIFFMYVIESKRKRMNLIF